MKVIFKWINILLLIGFVFIALGVAYVIIPYFGNQALIVRSGSMSPAIDAGSIVVIRPGQYNQGDIIAFRSESNPETIITHRIINAEVGKTGVSYKTKGDANKAVDNWLVNKRNVLGRVYFTLPMLGYLLAFAKSFLGFSLLIVLPAALVVLLELYNIIKEIRRRMKSSAKLSPDKFNLTRLKILIPLLIIGLAIPSAFAFPSDTEENTNNIFSAAKDFSGASSAAPTPTPTLSTINPGDVVINEIMWMGSQGNAADEWIELRNMTNSTIDLSNWTVVNLGTGSGGTITIPAGRSIEGNGFFIISNDDNDPQSTSIMSIMPDYFDSGVSLLNPGERLTLRDSPGNVIDAADNDGDGWFAGADNPEKSMERNIVPGDGTISANWHTASAAANLDLGATEIATPRAQNEL